MKKPWYNSYCSLNTARNTAGLCKGSTADSDSVCEGSNPSPAARKDPWNRYGSRDLFCAPSGVILLGSRKGNTI